jgi:hypothetical protein
MQIFLSLLVKNCQYGQKLFLPLKPSKAAEAAFDIGIPT